MKKIIAIFALFLLFITACGTQKTENAATNDSTVAATVKDTLKKDSLTVTTTPVSTVNDGKVIIKK